MDRKIDKARERYSQTANEPPVDPRRPAANPEPGSHSTGGARDHARPGDSQGPQRP